MIDFNNLIAKEINWDIYDEEFSSNEDIDHTCWVII